MADLVKKWHGKMVGRSESYVVSLCSGMDGNSVLSGHLDGTVNRFIFATETSAPVIICVISSISRRAAPPPKLLAN